MELRKGVPIEPSDIEKELVTPTGAAKDVRQFGFDISAHDVSYAAGDSLGVYVTNSG